MNLISLLSLIDEGRVKLTGSIKTDVMFIDELIDSSGDFGFDFGDYIVNSFSFSILYNCILIDVSKGD